MSQFNETNVRQFPAGGALGECIRVKIVSGQLAAAVAVDGAIEIGVNERPASAAGQRVPVRIRNHTGSHRVQADGVIAAGAQVFTAAAGQVSATQGTGSAYGIALEAAAAAGDIIEVIRTGG